MITFKEVNKKNMAAAVKVLTRVTKTSWPFGMAHIKEIQSCFSNWTVNDDLDWEWLDCIPFDFYCMEKEVQRLFVRNIILLQIQKSRPEVRILEQLIREREEAKMDRAFKLSSTKNFATWHNRIDDF
jgi:hypothetical protein